MQDSRSRAESGFLPIGAIKPKQLGILLLLLLPAFKFSWRLIDVPRRTREANEARCPIHASPIIILGNLRRRDLRAPNSSFFFLREVDASLRSVISHAQQDERTDIRIPSHPKESNRCSRKQVNLGYRSARNLEIGGKRFSITSFGRSNGKRNSFVRVNSHKNFFMLKRIVADLKRDM